MFKKQKSKNEITEEQFKQPKIKHSREIKTHLKERTAMEKIFYLFNNPAKRKTVFRMILSLPQQELNRNLYMIADLVLNTLIQDKNIDKNFYIVLSKLLKSENSECLNILCSKYLKAQLSFDPTYYTFLEYLIRHFKSIILSEKETIAHHIENKKMKERVLNIEESSKIISQDYQTMFYFLRQ